MLKVVTVDQMRAIEQQTAAAGISYAEMMENAGRGVAEAIQDQIDVTGRKVVVLVGPGNNGGDGLVAGRYLVQAGAEVAFFLTKPRNPDDPNYAAVVSMGIPVIPISEKNEGSSLKRAIARADIVIDALLGTGVDRPIGGKVKSLLKNYSQALDENRRRQEDKYSRPVSPVRPSYRSKGLPLVVAVDCPSGLNCDTGELDPVALEADLTVTFDSPKLGHYIFPGAGAVGDLVVADIGTPDGLPALEEVTLNLATADGIRQMLPPRPLEAHKGTFGKVMIAAGSVNYVGAAGLAGEAAYRTGAGLVTLAIPAAIHAPLAAHLMEATYILLPHEMGAITETAAKVLMESLEGYDALLIGPGLGRDEKTKQFIQGVLAGKQQATKGRIGFMPSDTDPITKQGPQSLPALVVDADGLNLLSELEDWPTLLPANTILTPHPGEMARLLGCDREQIAVDRIGTARSAAAKWGQIVLLKGAFSVVAAPDGPSSATIIPFADPALATAGSGDVLAGAIVALLGMGLKPFDAAVVGAFLHGAAGQRAGEEIGRAGVAAGDLGDFLAVVVDDLSDR